MCHPYTACISAVLLHVSYVSISNPPSPVIILCVETCHVSLNASVLFNSVSELVFDMLRLLPLLYALVTIDDVVILHICTCMCMFYAL